ncbi:diacylglycerol kinase catalytic domain-containing protein [Arachidicoccus terrestris]|uniref:hypothetical protein n=1 Tax=Arachidicoccus terrestris TaxID=2875539 RepID=UPI001CC6BE1B|nr:hypothetical protein [Arachidicoccus terrestris]UAY56977.1 hypothetical protein K9M52_08315 [Arachidicoccus terrestris]
MKIEYAILVKNKTRLEVLIEKFNTKDQARFYIEHAGGNFTEYEKEHEQFHHCFREVQLQLSRLIKNKIIDREFLPSYIFAENNLIVVVGQDGLVANVAKYSKGLPIIAVNPDAQRYDGILLPCNSKNFMQAVASVLQDNYESKIMRFAEVRLNDGQSLLAVNDLFIGISSHVSARYKIRLGSREEMHSSSGIIVATKTGSTGWLSSIFNMASGLLKAKDVHYPVFREDDLFFVVREPYKSRSTQTGICGGRLKKGEKIFVESMMPSKGLIFSDGIEQDFLQFNSGAIAEIGLSEQTAQLVTGPSRRKNKN